MASRDLNQYGMLSHNTNTDQMTILLNRIERRLGLSVMPLPDNLKKDEWAHIIMEDTIPVFSQYFPYQITTVVTPEPKKDGWFFIDQNLPEGTRILGVRDVDFQAYRSDPRFDRYGITIGAQDWLSREYCTDDIALQTVGADLLSLFNLGIYVEFNAPNHIKLVSANNFPISQYRPFPLMILIQHPGLWTISPTMMETFTRLAMADVATAIYQVLKYYDNMDTAYANLSLQLDTLAEVSNSRSDIIRELDEAHVSTANEYSPIIMTI